MGRILRCWWLAAGIGVAACISAETRLPVRPSSQSSALRFEVALAQGVVDQPVSGRLVLLLARDGTPEPRLRLTEPGPLVRIGVDVVGLTTSASASVDGRAATFPIERLSDLPPGEYELQAVLRQNGEVLGVANGPGDLYSAVRRVRVDPRDERTIRVELAHQVPDEPLPADGDDVRFVRLRSSLLSAFHGRDMYLRAGVILPRGYDGDERRRYPLRMHVGGYGSRYTEVQNMMAVGSDFRRTWLADGMPPMILLHLDGAGPFGDPYQIDSTNNGPYGRAITEELIPYVERSFRAVGEPRARVLDGVSTGGWVALALQIFYPDFFAGAWAFCPDSVDFRAFQLLNIYEDANAYVTSDGRERPSVRSRSGRVSLTMREEVRLENVLGAGDSWTMSGQQWGAWNAAYGPRGADGRPAPLWNPQTGIIDRSVVDHWRQYDLRRVLEEGWPALGPKLQGKLHLWAADHDDYYLEGAVRRLHQFLSAANPPYQGAIIVEPGVHCDVGPGEREVMEEMGRVLDQGVPVLH